MMAKKPENDALKSACDGRKLREEEKGNGKKMSQKYLAFFLRGLSIFRTMLQSLVFLEYTFFKFDQKFFA